jgi:alkylation response protein AidB-like acyl-CoA dehydrogenase
MSMSFKPLFPGLPLDAASRFAQDHAALPTGPAAGDPIREMGWACTLVPEAFGGVGAGLGDLAAVVEGLAMHGLQLPVIESCAVVPLALQAARDAGARWLEAVCEGSATLAPLCALAAPLDEIAVEATQLDIGWELSGEVRGVDVSLAATHYLVPALLKGSGETAIFVLEAARAGAPAGRFRTMDGRQSADFDLVRLAVPAGACIARGPEARAALLQAGDAALLLAAVDTVASLATLIEQTVVHLKERRQFGVALSSFQVLRHRTADMYVRYLGARGLLMRAFQDCEQGAAGLRRTLGLMKVSLAETARACAEAAIQMHGGMGVSEEVLATRMAQRLLASEFRFGDRLTHASRLLAAAPDPAGTLDAPSATPVSRSSR